MMNIDKREMPLVTEIISLDKIKDLDFINVSYREWVAFYGEWIIVSYPFSVNVTSPWRKDGSLLTYEDFKYAKSSRLHHSDFKKGLCGIDPCDIFEDVCGIRIHHGESDDHLMGLFYENGEYIDKKFDSSLIGYIRGKRLEGLGIR